MHAASVCQRGKRRAFARPSTQVRASGSRKNRNGPYARAWPAVSLLRTVLLGEKITVCVPIHKNACSDVPCRVGDGSPQIVLEP